MTEKTKDILTWLLVAVWLTLGTFFIVRRNDAPQSKIEPFPLQSAWQQSPPRAPEVLLP